MIQAVLNGPSGRMIMEPTGVTIGSASDNQLVMNNYAVSSHHAEIRPEERGYSIVDLGSAYGTFVNGQRLDWNAPYPLNPGDTILIGDTRYTFEMREAPQLEGTSGRADAGTDQSTTPLLRPDVSYPSPVYRPLEDASPAYTAYSVDLPEAYQSPVYPPYPVASPSDRMPGQPSYVPQAWSTTDIRPEDAGVTNLSPKKRSRRKLWIPLGIVVVIALLATALAYFFVIRSTPEKTLDAFCHSMQKGDYRGAYGQFSSSLQKTESEPQFESENKGTSCTHSSTTQSGGIAKASLTTTSSSGTKSSGQVTLIQDSNNNWKIDTLPSTPYTTLDAFCNGIQTRDYQKVYNQLSSRVQSQDSEPQFASSLAQSGIAYCTYGTLTESSTTATGGIVFFSATGQTASYIVTLVKEGDTWKIDNIASS